MTCTGCRYGERPTIWPGWRPGFSNSTSKRLPDAARREMPPVAGRSRACSRCRRSDLHLFGDLLGHLGGRRARPRRILEREGAGEADLVDQRQRRLEIVLGLAGEADDEVGGERHVGPRRAHPVDDARDSRRRCGGGSSRRGCGRSPTAPAGAAAASAPADRDARRSGCRPCRRDGWWCSAAARCPARRRGDAAGGRASRRGRPVPRRDRR